MLPPTIVHHGRKRRARGGGIACQPRCGLIAALFVQLALIPRDAPAFAFLDPEGSELAWDTVTAIAEHNPKPYKKVEQLILLPTDMGFVRTLPLPSLPSSCETVSRTFLLCLRARTGVWSDAGEHEGRDRDRFPG
ncbi:MAG: hypothetical protein LC777_17035, partial [Actinobacteria bacterium]|nr:hypothetical protein [Actinomycetota bacterium]